MEELIRFFLVAILVALFAPQFMYWLKIISKEKMIEYYKSVGAIPKKQKK